MVLPPTVAGFPAVAVQPQETVLEHIFDRFDFKGGTDMAWLYPRGDSNRISTHVPECQEQRFEQIDVNLIYAAQTQDA